MGSDGDDSSGEFDFPAATRFETRGARAKEAALEGDARAQHSLGLLYYGGYGGLGQSDELSAMWHGAAAAFGNWDAVAVLGGCLRKGSGIEENAALGLRLISLASAAENSTGLIKVGGLLEEQGDLTGALVLFRQAAEQGSALGMFCVGWVMWYRKWKTATKNAGNPHDSLSAQQLWRRAAGTNAQKSALYCMCRRKILGL